MQELSAGQSLAGRFRIVRRLGRGGMGSVYEAEEIAGGGRVALKVLSPDLVEDPRFVERFRREAEATAKLRHPNIIRVHELVHVPPGPALIVMERLRGESLLDRVRRGPLPQREALSLATQLTGALAAAHGAGVVHRDLKPANVFLVPVAHGGVIAKLLDFGIAKLKQSDGYRRLTQTGVLLGTPRYASPEQLRGERGVGPRSDVFSLGVLLYGMLAGRPPFTSKGAALILAIQEEEPPPLGELSDASPALVEIVARAMAKRAEDRFESMEAFEAALGFVARAPLAFVEGATLAEPAARDSASPTVGPSTPPASRTAPTSRSPAPAHRPSAGSLPPGGAPATRALPRTSAVPPAPARGTPRASLPGIEPARAPSPAAPRPTRRAASHTPASRPSAPDATVHGLPGLRSRTRSRALLAAGGLLFAVATVALSFVLGAFWFRSGEGSGRSRETDDWVYTASSNAQALGDACVEYERRACVCESQPLAYEACSAALVAIHAATEGSGRDPRCAERSAALRDCGRPVPSPVYLQPGDIGWSTWAHVRALQTSPECSWAYLRVCQQRGDGTPACLGMQRDLIASPHDLAARARARARCGALPAPLRGPDDPLP